MIEYYTLTIEYCEPTIAGPFPSSEARDANAVEVRNDISASEDIMVMWLDIEDGKPFSGPYSDADMEVDA